MSAIGRVTRHLLASLKFMERSFEPPAQFEQVRTRARGAMIDANLFVFKKFPMQRVTPRSCFAWQLLPRSLLHTRSVPSSAKSSASLICVTPLAV